jgi:hypothetical protein
MDLPNILNSKGSAAAAAAAAEQQLQQQLADAARANGRSTMSNPGSERGISPHMSNRGENSQPLHAITNMANSPRFSDPQTFHQALGMVPRSIPNGSLQYDYDASQDHMQQQLSYDMASAPRPNDAGGQGKAFACSSCGKGFARRSDLARHGKHATPPFDSSLLICR